MPLLSLSLLLKRSQRTPSLLRPSLRSSTNSDKLSQARDTKQGFGRQSRQLVAKVNLVINTHRFVSGYICLRSWLTSNAVCIPFVPLLLRVHLTFCVHSKLLSSYSPSPVMIYFIVFRYLL